MFTKKIKAVKTRKCANGCLNEKCPFLELAKVRAENEKQKDALRYLMGAFVALSDYADRQLKDFGADYELHNVFCARIAYTKGEVLKLENIFGIKHMDIFQRGDYSAALLLEKVGQGKNNGKGKGKGKRK